MLFEEITPYGVLLQLCLSIDITGACTGEHPHKTFRRNINLIKDHSTSSVLKGGQHKDIQSPPFNITQ